MPLYLGIDGGGTKTSFLLLSADGTVRSTFNGPSSYYLEHGIERIERVFVDGVAAVTERAGIGPEHIDFAFFAIPGYGESSANLARMSEMPRVALGHERYACGNDMTAAWAGSLAEEDGINVVAGTGSMTYGVRRDRDVRVGGWGELLGDEGSGYWIGLEALTAFTRMSDGRLPRTDLYEAVRNVVDVANDLDVIDVVSSQWEASRARIASLAPIVAAAADRGDIVARGILERAARQLVELVDTARANLGFTPGEIVPVSYSGGVFKISAIRRTVTTELQSRSVDYDFRPPRLSPVVGSALHAARLGAQPLDAAAIACLEREARNDTSLGLPRESRTSDSPWVLLGERTR
ncbi:N-acetylglucosamine kinase [Paramicrobacterium agarici]|uniref:N-acetylglucosamine kinase-like BadF-type ATPase n=1 Tax=Paramicrobacterium agarici TaxID=630514 RepID=A0A2A9DVR2_9MICO|nr:BadF/BadG/BcrA/BcrD ATPase family protein [Microbacterium agarici]PFG30693.1 N-acetylglucosamine kinase-like BadF-type ATPase [Microbacterium agarici]